MKLPQYSDKDETEPLQSHYSDQRKPRSVTLPWPEVKLGGFLVISGTNAGISWNVFWKGRHRYHCSHTTVTIGSREVSHYSDTEVKLGSLLVIRGKNSGIFWNVLWNRRHWYHCSHTTVTVGSREMSPYSDTEVKLGRFWWIWVETEEFFEKFFEIAGPDTTAVTLQWL